MATVDTTDKFRTAVAQLQSENYFGNVILQLNCGDTVAECEVLDDVTLTVLTPDTATLESALDSANTASASQTTIESAQAGLKDKVSLASSNADNIKTLFNAVLDQTIDQTIQPTRFENLNAVLATLSIGFRNRLITDIQEELGFDVTGTLTATQQRQACLYIRMWITPLAVLLSKA